MDKYSWPGNVRELKNLVAHLVSLTEGPRITFSDLPEYITNSKVRANTNRNHISDLFFIEARKQIMQELRKNFFPIC